jgi:LexA-binding, inner membrane-associated putative hydrolase
MLAEHLVFTAAVAIIAGMLSFRYTGRDSSWIVLLVSYAPDLDKITNFFLQGIGIVVMYDGHSIHHGTFHTVAAMIFFGIVLAFILHPFGIRFFDTFIFTVIGYGAHLFEDALVYPANYMYLWPLSSKKFGLAWLPVGSEESYNASFLHIANTEVLVIGLLLIVLAVLVRTRIEGSGWIRWYMPARVYDALFSPLPGEKSRYIR